MLKYLDEDGNENRPYYLWTKKRKVTTNSSLSYQPKKGLYNMFTPGEKGKRQPRRAGALMLTVQPCVGVGVAYAASTVPLQTKTNISI